MTLDLREEMFDATSALMPSADLVSRSRLEGRRRLRARRRRGVIGSIATVALIVLAVGHVTSGHEPYTGNPGPASTSTATTPSPTLSATMPSQQASEAASAESSAAAAASAAAALASATATTTMPNVIGLSTTEAHARMFNAGLTVGQTAYLRSTSLPKDTVMSTSPAPGASCVIRSKVDLTVSSGP
jgi:hypothetical protein